MTLPKLGSAPAPCPVPTLASTPPAVQGLLATFGEGATRRAAEAALEAHAPPQVSRLPPAPTSSVARRPGGASDPRLSFPGEASRRVAEQARVDEMKALFESPAFQARLAALAPGPRAQVLPIYQNLQNIEGFVRQPSNRKQALLELMAQAESWTPQNQPILFAVGSRAASRP